MSSHVHLAAIPERQDSLARLIRRAHSAYAQDFNRPALEARRAFVAKSFLFLQFGA